MASSSCSNAVVLCYCVVVLLMSCCVVVPLCLCCATRRVAVWPGRSARVSSQTHPTEPILSRSSKNQSAPSRFYMNSAGLKTLRKTLKKIQLVSGYVPGVSSADRTGTARTLRDMFHTPEESTPASSGSTGPSSSPQVRQFLQQQTLRHGGHARPHLLGDQPFVRGFSRVWAKSTRKYQKQIEEN